MKVSNLPNAICVLRMLLVVPILWTLSAEKFTSTLLLFLVAGFSDGLDGFLAKQFDWRSELGALLDPIADKLLLVATFLAVTLLGLIPVWLTACVIGRDLLIVSGALGYHYLVGPVQGAPSLASKLNTALQILFILLVVARAAYGWPGEAVIIALGAGVFVTTVVSGIDYIWTWSRRAFLASRERTA
ncbi:CDP-alcohol phosphatidyltransferase family protein [soil metagenome]